MIDLSPLCRFISPKKQAVGTYETSWTLTSPWKPSGVSGSTSWDSYEKLPSASTADLIDCVTLTDSAGNTFPILEGSDSDVEYFANIVAYSNGSSTLPCIDFPAFGGSIYAPTSVTFTGQGTSGGITALNFTYENVNIVPYSTGITPRTPEIQPNSFLTNRNGEFVQFSANVFRSSWSYNGMNRISFIPETPIITGIYGYYSSARGIYYCRAQYNNASSPNASASSSWMASVYCPSVWS